MDKIVFSPDTDNEFVSAPIQVTTDFGINLEFAEGVKSSVILYQSMTGVKYQAFKVDTNVENCYDMIVAGVIPGMFIKIRTSDKPSDASILHKA